MIAVIDYGRGNLFSLLGALQYLGCKHKLVSNPLELKNSFTKIILPGVGAFGDAIYQLKKKKFFGEILNIHKQKLPILGICLGMQLFASKSYEFSETSGLNIIPGAVKKLSLDSQYNIPNMGWRRLEAASTALKEKIKFNKMMYFVHSYAFYPKDEKHILSYINIGSDKIPAIVRKNNVIGFQFHPERSSTEGLDMLNWFLSSF